MRLSTLLDSSTATYEHSGAATWTEQEPKTPRQEAKRRKDQVDNLVAASNRLVGSIETMASSMSRDQAPLVLSDALTDVIVHKVSERLTGPITASILAGVRALFEEAAARKD